MIGGREQCESIFSKALPEELIEAQVVLDLPQFILRQVNCEFR